MWLGDQFPSAALVGGSGRGCYWSRLVDDSWTHIRSAGQRQPCYCYHWTPEFHQGAASPCWLVSCDAPFCRPWGCWCIPTQTMGLIPCSGCTNRYCCTSAIWQGEPCLKVLHLFCHPSPTKNKKNWIPTPNKEESNMTENCKIQLDWQSIAHNTFLSPWAIDPLDTSCY